MRLAAAVAAPETPHDCMSDPLANLAWDLAFGDMSPEQVFALREGSAWRLLAGGAENRFTGLLSIADLDAFLRTDAARHPRVSMADGGRQGSAAIPPDEYLQAESSRVDMPRLLARYDSGGSLVVSQFHELHAPLARFCRGLEKVFLHPVQANIYLTPPGAQGFRVHFDTHDVLVLQVSGAKSWRVWDDIPFPQPSRATPWANKQSPGGTPHALTLNPGDALYLPRGVMHEAAAQSGAAPSLHITIGFLEASVADMLREVLEILEAENPALRASIPSWRLAEPDGAAAIAARMTPAIAALSSEAARDRMALAALDRITRDRLPLPQRSLAHRPPAAGDMLRLSDTMHHHLVPLPEGGGALRWYGGVESLSAKECAWITQLAEGATPASLGENALPFCQRLAALGLLER
ncbi:MAG: hypothetical protein FJX32_15970 [Alphaproteobacteria bacterium]|nr:hypothetical protein [Alphaproteobacteria bacterium]